jgi:uncharacterized protein (DUF2235 family)
MPPLQKIAIMPKNVLIFSDGTGQAGGITFDENRTNIYKLFRATRCGPDSTIDPSEQVAFYGPGLGSPRDNRFAFGWLGRKFTISLVKAAFHRHFAEWHARDLSSHIKGLYDQAVADHFPRWK